MTLNQTLGRIFKMLEAMSRQPCGPIASARCCCSDIRSLFQRAADNSYRQNCWWCERREIWKNRSVQLFVPCPCRRLVPLPGMHKLPKCSAYPYQWLPGVPKLTYAQTKSKKPQGAFKGELGPGSSLRGDWSCVPIQGLPVRCCLSSHEALN